MGNFFVVVISWALSTFLLKLTTAIGVGFLTYKGLYLLVDELLDLIQPMISQLPASILSIVSIAGVPEAMTIICSALLTRAAINSARAFVGVIS